MPTHAFGSSSPAPRRKKVGLITYYKGNRLRSVLEAQWAVFLDALGEEWEYEPDMLECDPLRVGAIHGMHYCPDFKLSEFYLEIKPIAPTPREIAKASSAVRRVPIIIVIVWGFPPGDGSMSFSGGLGERQDGGPAGFCPECMVGPMFDVECCGCGATIDKHHPKVWAAKVAAMEAKFESKTVAEDINDRRSGIDGVLGGLDNADLTDKERDFIRNMRKKIANDWPLTENQEAYLQGLIEKHGE